MRIKLEKSGRPLSETEKSSFLQFVRFVKKNWKSDGTYHLNGDEKFTVNDILDIALHVSKRGRNGGIMSLALVEGYHYHVDGAQKNSITYIIDDISVTHDMARALSVCPSEYPGSYEDVVDFMGHFLWEECCD